jgi:hypothetical protein
VNLTHSFRWKSRYDEVTSKLANAIDHVYPNRPKPGVESALPPESFTGTYFNPGYLYMILEVADPKETKSGKAVLTSKRTKATWSMACEFVHVTGEYWIMYMDLINAPFSIFREYAPVRFVLGSDGRVASMVIEWRDILSDLTEGSATFDRLD